MIDSLGAGGAERSLVEMLPGLRRRGIDPTVACFHRADVGFADGVPSDRRQILAGSTVQKMRALRRLARDGYQLIHTTLFESDVFGRTAVAGLRVPVLTSLVNMPYERARSTEDPHVTRLKLAAARLAEAATGHLVADHYHAITRAVKEAAVRRMLIPRDRVTVVYRGRDAAKMGVRTTERRRRVRDEWGLEQEAFVVLTAGRQEYQKGQRFLVDAFSRVRAELPRAVLVIAGREGNASESLRRMISELDLGDRVRILGHVSDVPSLMAAADVFAFPSLWEGLGCVMIEAMALELPCVASDLPPIREITDDGAGAAIVPPGDPAALAKSLLRLAKDGDHARQLARRGRSLYEQRLTLEGCVRQMAELYERLV